MNSVIPQAIEADVMAALRKAGDASTLRQIQAASPGGVSDTLRLKTDAGDYFLKWNSAPWFGTFATEAFQLSLLRQTDTVRVPVVVDFAEHQEGYPAWMLQRWAGAAEPGDERHRIGSRLGERLAALHLMTAGSAPGYGYAEREPEGAVRLPTQDWLTFLYEGHFRHNIERARKENRWTAERSQRVDRLIQRLPDLLGAVNRTPTMLHGDLHSGNVRLAEDGEPVVADPWLFYGDRELEIVSTLLSGDFPSSFYETYRAVYPLETGFEERVDLYKLVWLLGGLCYSSDPASGEDNAKADPILAHYVG